MRKLPWVYLSATMGVLFGGLVLTHHHQASPSMVLENYAAHPTDSPRQDSLEYHLMMGDLAWQRQLWEQAATHYATVAKATYRADFALLATSAALEADLLPLATQNAQLWAHIEPLNARAQALTAALCITQYDETQALSYLHHLMEYTSEEALPHLMTITATLQEPQEQQLFFSLLQELSLHYEHEPSIWFVLARQAQTLEYYAFALEATDHTLALKPDWVSAIALRVQLLYQSGEKILARDYLATVLEYLPDEVDLQFIHQQIDTEIQSGL